MPVVCAGQDTMLSLTLWAFRTLLHRCCRRGKFDAQHSQFEFGPQSTTLELWRSFTDELVDSWQFASFWLFEATVFVAANLPDRKSVV